MRGRGKFPCPRSRTPLGTGSREAPPRPRDFKRGGASRACVPRQSLGTRKKSHVPADPRAECLECCRFRKTADPKTAGLFASPPATRPAGWWRNDHVEQSTVTLPGFTPRSMPSLKGRPANAGSYRVTGSADHDLHAARPQSSAEPPAHAPEPVADAVGAVVSHRRLSRIDLQLLLVRRSIDGRRIAAGGARRTVASADAVGPRRAGFAALRAGLRISASGVARSLFSPEEIIHLKYPNPLDPHYGLSPLQANALTVDANTELHARATRRFMPGNGPASFCKPIRRSASRPFAGWRSGFNRGSAAGRTGIGRWFWSKD